MKIIKFVLILLLLLAGAFYYAMEVEPDELTVTRLNIVNERIPLSFHGFKIVQFSDTHLGPDYSVEQLQMLVEAIRRLGPDIVVFTGDLIDHFGKYGSENREEAQRVLAQINAPYGKFAVYGNHDRGGGGSRGYRRLMEEAGFTLLVNESRSIQSASGESIAIAGLDDFLLGRPDAEAALSLLQEGEFNLLLVHEPDVADRLVDYSIDLQLSGHSHGGQVRLPFFKPLVTTSLGSKYVEGMYTLQGGSKPLTLYVNRGIGTTRLPLRLSAPPELTVFQLMQLG
ncbi:metallophosphoesterase [Paenibacillus sp. GCM10027627]|uniref:metallophosphoesterase n=1 Tax=unclassified Paenibacillus TaxID=185978 RepID=UPI003635320C